MVFNSLTFVVFFACVLALHAMPFAWTTRKINLLIASYLFYAAWNPPFVILLWISTVVDWYAAQGLVKSEKPNARRTPTRSACTSACAAYQSMTVEIHNRITNGGFHAA